ncbi:MAG: ATP-binding protein [Pirellulales bacterium]
MSEMIVLATPLIALMTWRYGASVGSSTLAAAHFLGFAACSLGPAESHDHILHLLHQIPVIASELFVVVLVVIQRRTEADADQKSCLLSESVQALEQAQSLGKFGNWSYDLETGRIQWSRQLFVLHGRQVSNSAPSFEELLGSYTDESAAELGAAVQTTITSGIPYRLILEKRNPSDGVRYIRAEGHAQMGADGKCRALMGTCMDVTAEVDRETVLHDARHAAEEANRSKSEFLANMSHEIRTPMTAIIGYADLLTDELPQLTDEERIDYVQTIRRNGVHLLEIINDILDISKIEADKMTVERIAVSPSAVMDEVKELMQVKADAKGLTLEVRERSTLPTWISTDPTRLRQILLNLVGNAVKFTETGFVRVDMSYDAHPKQHLVVDVTDSGIGMDEQQLAKVFDAFVQADTTTTRRFGGSGLGLRISKRLAELLGGELTVSSRLGVGSSFRLTVDASVAAPALASPVSENRIDVVPSVDSMPRSGSRSAAEAGDLHGMRILLAEDGPDNQKLISFHLKKAHADVVIVQNGKELLEHLSADGTVDGPLREPLEYDLIISDMQMPEIDGYQAAAQLRAKGCTIPILALTAHAMSGEEARCLESGCSAYQSKPIDRAVLIKQSASLVEHQKQFD